MSSESPDSRPANLTKLGIALAVAGLVVGAVGVVLLGCALSTQTTADEVACGSFAPPLVVGRAILGMAILAVVVGVAVLAVDLWDRLRR